jgi:hypothetical protein
MTLPELAQSVWVNWQYQVKNSGTLKKLKIKSVWYEVDHVSMEKCPSLLEQKYIYYFILIQN